MHVVYEMAAAYHPQLNGITEGAVRKAKDIIKRCTDAREHIESAVLEMNNFCSANLLASPAETFFKRSMRSMLPKMYSKPDHADIVARK